MADYVPPLGDLIQFGFFPISVVEPKGDSIPFAWVAEPFSYYLPLATSVNFSLKSSPRYIAPLYDVVNFEIKNYTQAESLLYAILEDVRTAFICIEPLRATLNQVLANVTSSILIDRPQAWAGTFTKVLGNTTGLITGLVPIAIQVTFTKTLDSTTGEFLGTAGTSTLKSDLQDLTSNITIQVPIPIDATLDSTLADFQTAFTTWHLLGVWQGQLGDSSTIFYGRVPIPITGTFQQTLASTVGSFSALHYIGFFYRTFADVTGTATGIVPIAITGTLFRILGDTTGVLQGMFAGSLGTLSATFINTAILIRGGSAVAVVFDAVLGNFTTDFRLRTPIYITGSLIKTLDSLNRIITGRVWPTGSLYRLLYDLTGTIYGTLPIFAHGPLFAYTYPLIPYFRVGIWPAGHFNKSLSPVVILFSLQTPIQINVPLDIVTGQVTSDLRLRTLIGGYINRTTESVYVSWYLQFTKPKEGHINAVLWVSGLFYAKTITFGSWSATLAPITTQIQIIVPIRIFVGMTLLTGPFTNVYILGKAAIGGVLSTITTGSQFLGYGRALVGLALEPILDDLTSNISIKVPLPTIGYLIQLLKVTTLRMSGYGHFSPVFRPTLAPLTGHFQAETENALRIDIRSFEGPTFTINKFYNANLGERWPIHSGKYWKMQIFANDGNQAVTTFHTIRLFAKTPAGELIDLLDGIPVASNFVKPNTEYSDEDGMLWEYTLPEDTEIFAYEIEGV